MIGALMLDIAGTELTQEDIELLRAPQVGGVILFARNIQSPAQVRALTDHMRQVRPDIHNYRTCCIPTAVNKNRPQNSFHCIS